MVTRTSIIRFYLVYKASVMKSLPGQFFAYVAMNFGIAFRTFGQLNSLATHVRQHSINNCINDLRQRTATLRRA